MKITFFALCFSSKAKKTNSNSSFFILNNSFQKN